MPSTPVPREPVTRDRAVRVAISLADAGGIPSLSMRKLAAELGIEAMSLYYHVAGKEDLLDGMVESVVDEMAVPTDGEPWRDALRRRADSARSVLARHPWAISQMDARTTQSTLRLHDAIIGCLLGAGFSIALAAHAMSLVDSYVHGFAQQEASLPTDDAGDISVATEAILEQTQRMQAFPNLSRMGRELVMQPGYAYGNEFEFGIELIIDGLQAALARESVS